MRVDNYVSDLGIVKRRTVVKELADGGHVRVNDQRAKPAHAVKVGDIIEITGKFHIKVKVLKIPAGKSIPRADRAEYFEILYREPSTAEFEL